MLSGKCFSARCNALAAPASGSVEQRKSVHLHLQIVVKYPSEGGYAPGDTWELYVGADHRVAEMIYHGGEPGIQKRPKLLLATWEGHKKAGPLLISMDHSGTADGKPLRLFFSEVSVKVTGSGSWMNAE